ncbi:MAG: TrmJ/YjtD family RNA methyltransferase [Sphingomonadales bacterium]|nr:TrmJ/YjtD family RNA methyltransferase [Sphingomonadales bacterium]
MAFWAYILKCADGTYYTGHTDDLELRIAQHHAGHFVDCYTRSRRPLELMWASDFPTRIEALESERRIKNWSKAKKEALIKSDWNSLSNLSIPPAERASRTVKSTPPPRAPSEVEGSPHTQPFDFARGERNLGPIIVLVRPQLGENIGKAARAMLNFGLTELRLVAPRDGWPNPSAGPAAAGADVVLEQAQVFDTLAEAVADCAHVYATTVRKRGVTKPVLTPEEAAQAVQREAGRSAYVFGPERSGLETEDVALARAIVTVPINPEFGSLNLAQAVILLAYEWSKHAALEQPTVEELLPPAPQEELEGMIAQLEAMLEPAGYFFPHSRAVATRLTLRTMLTKPGWNHLEVRTMRGVLSTLARKPRNA